MAWRSTQQMLHQQTTDSNQCHKRKGNALRGVTCGGVVCGGGGGGGAGGDAPQLQRLADDLVVRILSWLGGGAPVCRLMSLVDAAQLHVLLATTSCRWRKLCATQLATIVGPVLADFDRLRCGCSSAVLPCMAWATLHRLKLETLHVTLHPDEAWAFTWILRACETKDIQAVELRAGGQDHLDRRDHLVRDAYQASKSSAGTNADVTASNVSGDVSTREMLSTMGLLRRVEQHVVAAGEAEEEGVEEARTVSADPFFEIAAHCPRIVRLQILWRPAPARMPSRTTSALISRLKELHLAADIFCESSGRVQALIQHFPGLRILRLHEGSNYREARVECSTLRELDLTDTHGGFGLAACVCPQLETLWCKARGYGNGIRPRSHDGRVGFIDPKVPILVGRAAFGFTSMANLGRGPGAPAPRIVLDVPDTCVVRFDRDHQGQ